MWNRLGESAADWLADVAHDASQLQEEANMFTSDNCDRIANFIRGLASNAISQSSHPSATQEKFESVVATLRHWSDSLQGNAFQQGARYKYTSTVMLECVKMAYMLKGGAESLRRVIEAAMRCVMHTSAPASAETAPLPSPALIRYYELSLDIAIIKTLQKFGGRDWKRFNLADSSPQGGFDWLWSQHRVLRGSAILDTFKAAQSLILATAAAATAGDDDSSSSSSDHDQVVEEPREEWRPWLKCIIDNYVELVCVPSALAPGFSTAVHKAEAMCWQWAFSRHPDCSLDDYVGGFCSNTSDLGTEASIPDLKVSSPSSLLPQWYQSGSAGLEADVDAIVIEPPQEDAPQHAAAASCDGCDPDACLAMSSSDAEESAAGDVDGARCRKGSDSELEPEMNSSDVEEVAAIVPVPVPPPPPPPVPEQVPAPGAGSAADGRFMRNGFEIAGMMHSVDNMLAKVHTSMSQWDQFWARIKVLENFVCAISSEALCMDMLTGLASGLC